MTLTSTHLRATTFWSQIFTFLLMLAVYFCVTSGPILDTIGLIDPENKLRAWLGDYCWVIPCICLLIALDVAIFDLIHRNNNLVGFAWFSELIKWNSRFITYLLGISVLLLLVFLFWNAITSSWIGVTPTPTPTATPTPTPTATPTPTVIASVDPCKLFAVTIDSPHLGEPLGNGIHNVYGTYSTADSMDKYHIALLTLVNGEYWPEYIVDLPGEDGRWEGEVKLHVPRRDYSATIIVAVVGDASTAWWTGGKYRGDHALPLPLTNYSDIRVCRTLKVNVFNP